MAVTVCYVPAMNAVPSGAGRLLPSFLLTCSMLFWGANAVVSRAGSFYVPTTGLAFWAWVMAFTLLTPWAVRPVIRQRRAILRHWRIITVLGVLGIGLFPQFLYGALGLTKSINVSLINTATPAWIVALSWLCFRDPVSWRMVLGMVSGFLGVAVVVTQGRLSTLLQVEFVLGDVVMLIGIVVWAVYSILLRYRPPDIDSLALLWAMIPPAFLVSGAIYFSGVFSPWRFDPVADNLVFLAYCGVFPTVLAYACFNAGAKALGARGAGQFLFLPPLFTAILAVIFLDETFEVFHLISLLLIFAGLYFANATGGDKT